MQGESPFAIPWWLSQLSVSEETWKGSPQEHIIAPRGREAGMAIIARAPTPRHPSAQRAGLDAKVNVHNPGGQVPVHGTLTLRWNSARYDSDYFARSVFLMRIWRRRPAQPSTLSLDVQLWRQIATQQASCADSLCGCSRSAELFDLDPRRSREV
ncbi:hypothetical protein PMIN01_07074 [Paraphaeosphaeria minitans]|uniref:Uncharacterized protein n=1 Tax=Paraphaeosphaeria minitans TaxID=565426 RepID=A0A9P6KRJ4_9PLEO|nr:hypothetical protein PMIN01_07074 [Paraphaeosphaeria minitans]